MVIRSNTVSCPNTYGKFGNVRDMLALLFHDIQRKSVVIFSASIHSCSLLHHIVRRSAFIVYSLSSVKFLRILKILSCLKIPKKAQKTLNSLKKKALVF